MTIVNLPCYVLFRFFMIFTPCSDKGLEVITLNNSSSYERRMTIQQAVVIPAVDYSTLPPSSTHGLISIREPAKVVFIVGDRDSSDSEQLTRCMSHFACRSLFRRVLVMEGGSVRSSPDNLYFISGPRIGRNGNVICISSSRF